jgi:hypothetical protein
MSAFELQPGASVERGYQRVNGQNATTSCNPNTYVWLPWILDPINASTETLFDLTTDPTQPTANESGVYAISLTFAEKDGPHAAAACFYALDLDAFGADHFSEYTNFLIAHGTSQLVLTPFSVTGYVPAGGILLATVNHDYSSALHFYIGTCTIQRIS